MSTPFFIKYQAAGNDFILIDDRALQFDSKRVSILCHRRFGIGADGVILLQDDAEADFRMRIYNCDGSEAESCGNGLCCLMRFIEGLGAARKKYRIATRNRIVQVGFIGNKMSVEMGPVSNVKQLYICGHQVHVLDTGVPHAVVFSEEKLEVLGPLLQSHSAFQPAGTNVNVAQLQSNGSIAVRTYERGVGETMSCGTGAAAVGLIAHQIYQLPSPIRICFAGGEMEISIAPQGIMLIGHAIKVFEGLIP